MYLKNDKRILGEQAGLLWTWWRGDPLPTLPLLPTFAVTETESSRHMATLMATPEAEVTAMLQEGHRPYIAYLNAAPVAYGWSAINRAAFGEGRVKFRVPATDRYLYCFVTLPSWRGMGIYPRLLQAILKRESGGRSEVDSCSMPSPERFWIVHQLSNIPSARGIARAGFHIACKMYFSSTNTLVLVASSQESNRAHSGAELLGLPLIN